MDQILVLSFICENLCPICGKNIALRSALTDAQRVEMKSGATEDFCDVESFGWRARGCQKS
jgi:hypothetical protein